MRLLIVEDYQPLANSLARGLGEAGFRVDTAADGESGLALATKSPYDLVVIDVMLPKLDGYALLERLRAAGNAAGVIVLTARRELPDKIRGLDLGADDYVVKPFSFDELVARIRSVIRRRQGRPHPIISVADLSVDTVARMVKRGSRVIALSAREYTLLEYLATRAGEIATRQEILDHAFAFAAEPASNVVDVYVGYLRRKIDGESEVKLIRTHRGLGYSLMGPE